MDKLIQILKDNDLLKIIEEPLDINLEIPHIAYIEVKQKDSKAILFTNPIDKKNNKQFDIPVLMNIFCNEKAIELFVGDMDKIADEIEGLLKMKPPAGLIDKLSMFGRLFSLKDIFPKRDSSQGISQTIQKIGPEAKLDELPILKTWDQDGGAFITTGQVYTTSLDGTMHNLGMYRLQVYNKHQLGMHWQIHKDANHFFHQYKKANKKMPVSVAIGGDPLYLWCAQAPLPVGVFEMLLYGFIKKSGVKLVKSITNDIYVPHDADFIIEGFVDPNKSMLEGPFGDHTGYYTLPYEYPVMDVTAITYKKNPIFTATVVGKPPLEDKYMGLATQKIFLPLLKTTAPDLIDYDMPENGVFHNLILAKISVNYPAHAQQMMHAFWGVGQMSFVKHALFIKDNAPELDDYDKLVPWILDRLDLNNILISHGVVDALDHSSPSFAVGGKLGVDCTNDEVEIEPKEIISDNELLKLLSDSDIKTLKQYYTDTKTPVCIVGVDKTTSQKNTIEKLKDIIAKHCRLFVILDNDKNRLDNLYMIVWRVVNNIDSNRDIYIDKDRDLVVIDATNKNYLDGFDREWPDDVECNKDILAKLQEMGVINIDEEFINRFYLY